MSNIVGEGFPKEIIKQIDVRQNVYGSANRTNGSANTGGGGGGAGGHPDNIVAYAGASGGSGIVIIRYPI